jgi:Zn-dependent protease
MKIVFRKNVRPLVLRYVFAGLIVFLITRILIVDSWTISFFFAAFSVGIYALIIYLREYHGRCIVVDDHGVEQRFNGKKRRIPWSEAVGVTLNETDMLMRRGSVRVRYAVLHDVWGRPIAFSDLSLIGGHSIVINPEKGLVLSDVANPELLLAICAHRLSDESILAVLRGNREPEPGPEARSAGDSAAGAGERREAPEKREPARQVSVAGILVLLGKVGGKLVKGLAGIFKTVKPGFAIASGAVYGIFFSWKFALALMLMLFVHEYGHVYAMKRSGLRVRGIYFIPFLGAAAVTDDSWRSRAQQAYIALNGPLWGFFLTLGVFLLLFFVEGENLALLTGVAAWWAFINLFNLLPINPLDGGRLLSSLSYSISGKAARIVSFLAFAACLILALVFKIYLFAVLGIVGLLEFLTEMEVGSRAKQIDMAGGPEGVSVEGLADLKRMTRPMFTLKEEQRLRAMDMGRLRRLLTMSRITPMKGAAAARWALYYVLLTAAFVGVILYLSSRPEASFITSLLR